MVKKRGLNRGLEALLQGADSLDLIGQQNSDIQELPVERLQRGTYQPRRDMDSDALAELANSIRSHGMIQPIVVRTVGPGRYEIIAGERRWRAAQMAQLANVPVLVREVTDQDAIAIALIENIQREDLNPMEEAIALQRLQNEFAMTQQQVADMVGKSRSAIANLLRLMNLTAEVQQMLERGDLEMGHARALLALPAEQQHHFARGVVEKGMSVRQTESAIRHKLVQPQRKPLSISPDSNVASLQESLSEVLGSPVRIQQTAHGKGRLVIQYASLDQLDGIIGHLQSKD